MHDFWKWQTKEKTGQVGGVGGVRVFAEQVWGLGIGKKKGK